jgi:hypothetical protein
MVEIYNEQVRNLLSNNIAQKGYPSSPSPPQKIRLLSIRISLMIAFLVLADCQACTKKIYVVLNKKKHSES